MLDRLARAVAEIAGVEFVSLGLHSGDRYHFISTHGFPFGSNFDSVPATTLKKSLFSSAVEVSDLRKEAGFKPSGSIPIVREWRYGANVPVRLDHILVDDGVLALSIADRKTRSMVGHTMFELARIADQFADIIWLTMEVHKARSRPAQSAAIFGILAEGLHQSNAPLALVDDELNILDFSAGFVDFQKQVLNCPPVAKQSFAELWLDDSGEDKLHSAMDSGKAVNEISCLIPGSNKSVLFDFHILAFPEAAIRVGIVSVHFSCVRALVPALHDSAKVTWDTKPASTNDPDVVGRFLFDTLVPRTRLLHRNKYNYLTVRAWRKPIKPYQFSAMKALKTATPDAFVDQIATELLKAAEAVHGDLHNAVVVPIPCGHSGSECLSKKIAKVLAQRIGVEIVEAFEPIRISGSSHPKTNVRRPAMKLRQPPDKTVILVDDVASSGAHIEEACRLLSKHVPAIWPVVWVAD